MKKAAAAVMALTVASSLMAGQAWGAELKMIVGGKPLAFANGTPFVENGTSMMPLRDLLLGLGVQASDIGWNDGTVTAKLGDAVVTLKVGEKAIYLNGAKFKDLEVAAKTVDGRVYLPARAVAEAFGNKVGFDPATNSVLIEPAGAGGGTAAPGAGGGANGSTGSIGSTGSTGATNSGGSTGAVGGTFETKGGIPVTIAGLRADAGEIVGFAYDYNPATGEIAVKGTDGSVRTAVIADATALTFPNGNTHTGAEYKEWFHAGVSVVAVVNADGTAKALDIGYVQFRGAVLHVDSFESEYVQDGVSATGVFTTITLSVGGVEVLATVPPTTTLAALPQRGDTVSVTGTIMEDQGMAFGTVHALTIE